MARTKIVARVSRAGLVLLSLAGLSWLTLSSPIPNPQQLQELSGLLVRYTGPTRAKYAHVPGFIMLHTADNTVRIELGPCTVPTGQLYLWLRKPISVSVGSSVGIFGDTVYRAWQFHADGRSYCDPDAVSQAERHSRVVLLCACALMALIGMVLMVRQYEKSIDPDKPMPRPPAAERPWRRGRVL